MDFVQKSNFFLSAFFREIISEKIVFDIVERREWLKEQKIKVLTRAKKWTFYKGVSPWICPKSNLPWSLFFIEIMSERIVFRYFGEKTIIFRPKKWSFKKGQKVDIFGRWERARKWTFFKELGHGFCPKIELFLISVFTEIISKKIVFDIVERKEWF